MGRVDSDHRPPARGFSDLQPYPSSTFSQPSFAEDSGKELGHRFIEPPAGVEPATSGLQGDFVAVTQEDLCPSGTHGPLVEQRGGRSSDFGANAPQRGLSASRQNTRDT